MFGGKARSIPLEWSTWKALTGKGRGLPEIDQTEMLDYLKNLSWTNTLAYFESLSVTNNTLTMLRNFVLLAFGETK
jgi:hypothetical protein